MNRAILPVLGVAVFAMAGCAGQAAGQAAAPTTGQVSSPSADTSASQASSVPTPSGTPVQGGDPASPQTLMFTCTLGWDDYSTSQGGTVGPFHPGPAPSVNPTADTKPADGWNVTVYNGTNQQIMLNWVQTTFYLNGKSVGGQTTQGDTAETLNPGQSDNGQSNSGFGGMINPSNEPAPTNLTTGYQIENQHGASCAVTDWGNATGQ